MTDELEHVPLTAYELTVARRWATSQIGRPSTRTDTQPLSQRKATVLIYRLLATIGQYEEALARVADAFEQSDNSSKGMYNAAIEVEAILDEIAGLLPSKPPGVA